MRGITVAEDNTQYLYFNGVYPQGSYGRANGFQLRCLQEHPKGVLLGLSLPNFLTRQARLEYPAAPPGYRADLYGTFYCVGGYGHNWSSAIPAGSGSARLFEFRFNWLNPKNSGTRAHGLQLRCLQEKGGAAEPRDEASRSPSSPNPLGENQSLSSPPLKPRGLLLSVMRQKVGKERSQGDCHPLG